MSIESAAPLSPLRDLAHQNISQLDRTAAGWIELARKSLDAAEVNLSAFCDHARQLAQAESPAECVRLQTEFVKSSFASMQKQSAELMTAAKTPAE